MNQSSPGAISGLVFDHTVEMHAASRKKLTAELETSDEASIQCINPKYKDEGNINFAFAATDLEECLANTKIKLWVHGHTHDSVDRGI